MPFIGELAALGTSLCFSFGSTQFTIAGRQIGSSLVNRTRLLIALLLVMLLHFLTFGQLLPLDTTPERWFWLGLSGFVGLVLGDACLLQAFVLIGARLSMLMMSLAPVLGALLAWIFLGETLVPREVVGIAVVLIGIIVVIVERSNGSTPGTEGSNDRRQYFIGLLFGLGGAAGQAGGLVLSKLGMGGDFPALSANLIRLLAAAAVIWLIAIVNRQLFSSFRTLRANPRALLSLTNGTILGPVLGVWLTLVAVQNVNIGVASTLSSLMPIFLIPISYFMFGERVTKQAVFGTLVAVAGMVILFL